MEDKNLYRDRIIPGFNAIAEAMEVNLVVRESTYQDVLDEMENRSGVAGGMQEEGASYMPVGTLEPYENGAEHLQQTVPESEVDVVAEGARPEEDSSAYVYGIISTFEDESDVSTLVCPDAPMMLPESMVRGSYPENIESTVWTVKYDV